jgi:hypothetical protein
MEGLSYLFSQNQIMVERMRYLKRDEMDWSSIS